LDLWKQGKESRLFEPQFHGREHLNVQFWLRDLQKGNKDTLAAFNSGVWGVYSKSSNKVYQEAFDIDDISDLEYQKEVIEEGMDLFNQLLGYAPHFFVPTNGPFNLSHQKTLANKGIKYLILDKFQKELVGHGKIKRHLHNLGKRNRYGQIYMTRNAAFEPTQFPDRDNVDHCLKDIELAFRLNNRAVISTHRLNYIGAINEKNSSDGLKELSNLLKRMFRRWPNIEFMTSVELGETISEKSSQF